VALTVWRDTAKGVHNPDTTDLTYDVQKSDSNTPNTDNRRAEATERNLDDDEEHIIPSGPPSSRSSPPLEHDFDFDQSMEEEQRLTQTTGTPIDDDADLWADLPIPDDLDSIPVSPLPPDDAMVEDDQNKQMEAETSIGDNWRDPLTSKTTGLVEQPGQSSEIEGTNDEDIDSLYD
jgi:hypothetical protein